MRRLFALTCGLFLFLGAAKAQNQTLDSLLRVEKAYQQDDSVRVKLLTDIARRYNSVNPNQGVAYAAKAVKIAEKLPEKRFLATAHSVKGANHLLLSDFPGALDSYQKALEINESLGNKQGIANNYNNIGLVYYSILDFPKSLEYYQKTLILNEQTGNKTNMANCLGNIGNIHNDLQDYPRAIEYYEKALALSESLGNQRTIAGNLVNLGNVYTSLKDYKKALDYKLRALKINQQLGNQPNIANNLGNIGNVYILMNDLPAALDYHERARQISEKINDKKGAAFNYAGIGNVYFLQKDYPKAATYEYKAYEIASASGAVNIASEALLNLSKIYQASEKFDSAYIAYNAHVILRDSFNNVEKQKEVTRKTLQFEFGKKEELLRQQQIITDAKLEQQILLAAKQQQELELKQTAINLANKDKELQHLAYLKSQADLQFAQSLSREKQEELSRVENEKQLQATQVNLQQTQLELQDKELRARRTQGIFYLVGLALLSLLTFLIFRNFRIQQRSNRVIEAERQKSENLLLNILPSEVAAELKEQGQAAARHFDAVTVLFTDFVDFTKVSENLTPTELVKELHEHFTAFDEIIERHGLEKIKTIGDAYMAVSGLPVPTPDHARAAARAALEIRALVNSRRDKHGGQFDIRIGMHSGPVVAGIVGVKKFAYDIWGDTVNTAARMESGSEPGKINISEATRDQLSDKGEFTCVFRGKIQAKNKGEIAMYFLDR
ncbi:MAG: tetratricopeptide repeat protein [Saprospiraceae bacterium]|nr:tetratricopeptide repeat protein [Saprospiraceae bacterium]